MTQKKTALFYGDSNTYGFDPRGYVGDRYPAEVRWTDRVRGALEESWEILDDGMNGRVIPSSDLTMTALDRTLRRSIPLDLFAVMLGSNDLIFTDPHPTHAPQKLERMLVHTELYLERHSGGRDAQILVMAPPYNLEEGERLKRASQALGFLYRDIAQRHGYRFLDVGAQEFSLAYDGVHFSEEGHRQMAEFIIDELSD